MSRGLRAERQAEDADEAHGRGVVVGVIRVVGGQRAVVERIVTAAAHHGGVAMVEAQAHLAVDDTLRGAHVLAQVTVQGAEPDAVVGGLGQLVCDEAIEAQLRLGEGQALQCRVRRVQDGGCRGLVEYRGS